MLKTFVLTPVGRPRRELIAFLQAIPGLVLLNAPDGALPSGAELPIVDLLVFDAYAPSDFHWSLLGAARTGLAAAHCVALVSSPHQVADARAAGADWVLVTGFEAVRFLEVLQMIMNETAGGGGERWSNDFTKGES